MAKTKAKRKAATNGTGWRSRIVGQGEVAPGELTANPRNWRTHPKAQQDALAGVLSEVGWVQNVIVNKRTGHVVDGHARVALAISREEATVPVVYVDLDENEEGIILASLDPLAAMAETDQGKLDELMADITVSDEALREMLAPEPAGGLTDDDAVPEEPEEPTTKSGDLWLLGDHRLLCGDATKAEDVKRLMDGAKADALWTDPPYGVDYADLKGRHAPILGDDGKQCLVREALQLCEPETMFVCCNWQSYARISGEVADVGISVKAVIVWDKEVRTQNLDRFAKQHEWILYAGPFGGEVTLDTDVWRIGREVRSDHPTAKPVELISRAVGYTTGEADVVLDPFLGSGTTLIACEKLGRRCYGMEIEPRYVDVAVRRWEEYTGEKAVCE